MSHFPIKGQSVARFSLFCFFSLYCLSFTMIFFLFNWLVFSSSFPSSFPLSHPFSSCLVFSLFLTYLPLPAKKTQRSSSRSSSFFILPHVVFRTLIHFSLSFFLPPFSPLPLFYTSLLFLLASPPASTCRSPFVRSAVQSCSKSRVCSCWSSSISPGFWILTFFSPIGSRRTRKGDEVERTKDVARESSDLSYLNVNDPTFPVLLFSLLPQPPPPRPLQTSRRTKTVR